VSRRGFSRSVDVLEESRRVPRFVVGWMEVLLDELRSLVKPDESQTR
jgi:hypothetical protein